MKDKKIKTTEIQNHGTLYVVSTPIGNLEDITLRALRILKDVDLIAAENVRHSKGLCHHYGIKTRLTSYNQHNHEVKGHKLLNDLKAGSNIALITSAGTPGVSDPGGLLIHRAIGENVRVSPIPGPSAVTAALSVSGLQADRFVFLGFLSNRSGKRRRELQELVSEARSMVFFEAPHRIKIMLRDILEILGDRPIAIIREMTKVFEETKRGLISEILRDFEEGEIKGEFTLVVAGREKETRKNMLGSRTQKTIKRLLTDNRMGIREIATHLSDEEGLPYRTIYKECLNIKRAMER